MKVRNYEKKEFVLGLVVFLILIEFILFGIFLQRKEFSYQKVSGILVKKNLVLLIVEKDTRSLLYQNKKIFFNDQELSYEIEEDKKIEMKDIYYEILIKVKTPKDKKINEGLDFSIRNQKKKKIELLQKAWGGDSYRKN